MKSIKSKFIAVTVVFILVTFGIPFYFLVNQYQKNFKQRSEILLETTLDMLNYSLENEMMRGFDKDIKAVLGQIASDENIAHIRILNRNGIIEHSSDSVEIGMSVIKASPDHLMNNQRILERIISLRPSDGVYVAFEPIKNTAECQTCHGSGEFVGYLDVDTNLTEAETSFFMGSFHLLYLGIAVGLLLIAGFYIIFIYFIDSPLKRLSLGLDNIEKGDFSIKLPALKRDEFGKLEQQFNSMTAELESSRKKIDDLHNEQLIRADRLVTIGELTAQIAHEINNYSAVIMSRADYLNLESMSDSSLKKYKEDLDVIVGQIEKISEITNSILKHSRKLPREFSEVNIETVIEESLKILLPLFKKKNIELERKYSAGNSKIFGNAQQLEQVMLNIINNGIDALGSGGRITISLIESDNDEVIVKIRDNGSGIESSELDAIFTPFYTTKPPDQGTGLGLYIVKNICNNHNAEIQVESREGKGTEFSLIFPIKGESHA